MSMKKILACTAASVVAVSAMAVAASADEWNAGYVSGWTDKALITDNTDVSGLFGDADPADVESITFTATGADEWGIGFDSVDGWWQSDSSSDEQAWWDSSKEFTLPVDQIDFSKDALCFKLCANLSTGEEDLVISWTLNMKEAGADADSTADAGEETTGDATNADTGVEGVAAVLGVAAVAAGAMIVAKKRK